MTDNELISKILRGDMVSVQELHSRYVDRIFHYIYLQTNNYHDSEELLQDVFFKVARQLNQFEGRSSFKTWIFKIARNIVIDYYRKNKKGREFIIMDQDLMENLVGMEQSAENMVLQNLHMEEIIQTLDKLPHPYKTVLHLRFFEDFSINETATIMGKTTLSVKALQNRAKKALSKEIKLEVFTDECV